MSAEGRLPRWLKVANPLIVVLQRRGMVIGTVRLLSIPGRKSGKLRTTPVSPLSVDGERYVVAGFDKADWVKNARGGVGDSGAAVPRVPYRGWSYGMRAEVPRRGAAKFRRGSISPRQVPRSETSNPRRTLLSIPG